MTKKKNHSKCVWGDYFPEYSMKVCNNICSKIRSKKASAELEDICKTCELFVDKNGPFESCPFCKSKKILLVPDFLLWHARCQKCGAWGPTDRDPAKAIEKWNKRK